MKNNKISFSDSKNKELKRISKKIEFSKRESTRNKWKKLYILIELL